MTDDESSPDATDRQADSHPDDDGGQDDPERRTGPENHDVTREGEQTITDDERHDPGPGGDPAKQVNDPAGPADRDPGQGRPATSRPPETRRQPTRARHQSQQGSRPTPGQQPPVGQQDDETGRRMVQYLYWGAFGLLFLFGAFAAFGFYRSIMRVIDIWVSTDFDPLFSAAFNLVVVLVSVLGLSVLVRRLDVSFDPTGDE